MKTKKTLFTSVRAALSNYKKERGFTLLLAALVASIVLALGTSTFSIVYKEVQLSAIGRDSQFAFYAADTAAECALYYDARADLYTNTFATSSASKNTAAQITCDGQSAAVTIGAKTTSAATSTFEVNLFSNTKGGPYCADVTVGKAERTGGGIRTVVLSNGYNVSCATLAAGTSPTSLQRSVELEY